MPSRPDFRKGPFAAPVGPLPFHRWPVGPLARRHQKIYFLALNIFISGAAALSRAQLLGPASLYSLPQTRPPSPGSQTQPPSGFGVKVVFLRVPSLLSLVFNRRTGFGGGSLALRSAALRAGGSVKFDVSGLVLPLYRVGIAPLEPLGSPVVASCGAVPVASKKTAPPGKARRGGSDSEKSTDGLTRQRHHRRRFPARVLPPAGVAHGIRGSYLRRARKCGRGVAALAERFRPA